MSKEKASQEIRNAPSKKIKIEKEDKKNTKNTLLKVISYINEKYDFRYNEINTDTEYKLKKEKEYRYFDDMDYRDIYLNVLIAGGFSISDMNFKNIIYSRNVSKVYNPFKEYFKEIKGSWDGKTDMMKLFCQQVALKQEIDEDGFNYRELFVKHFTKWFVALIKSLIEDTPSMYYVNQACLILVGAQGRYKTTFLKNIVPKPLQLKYFYGSSFQPHNKDHEKYLAYKILINFDEMAAFNKTDIETIKSKLSQDQIVVRLPYAKADIHLKRRASFCGTENNTEILKDPTGSRRWLVFEVDRIILDDEFPIDAMYDQALYLCKKGFKYWFDEEDIRTIEKYNEQYTFKGFEEDLVEKHYAVPLKDDFDMNKVRYVSSTDIATYLAKMYEKINVNNTVIKNIGQSLRKMGFKKVCRLTNDNKRIPLWAVKELFEPGKTYPLNGESAQSEIF